MIEAIRAAFADAVSSGTHDIVQDAPEDDIEIQTDHWTIVFPVDPAQPTFVALDELTESDAEHRAGLDAGFSAEDLARLRLADSTVGGMLITRLTSSPDRLAVLLAERLG